MENVQKTTAPGSIVILTGTINADTLKKERAHAVQHLQSHVSVDGFRAGSIPEALIVAKVGERAVQEAAAEHAVSHVLQQLLVEQGILPLVPPNVTIDLQPDGSAKVEIKSTVYPTVVLPDYKKIAANIMKDKTEVAVTEEEVTDALVHMKRERMRIEAIEVGTDAEEAMKKAEAAAPEELPPLDDAFVSQIGFASAAAFEDSIRKNLQSSKEDNVRSEYRAKLMKELAKDITNDIPEALVEYELAKMEAGLAHYVAQMGSTIEAYYTQINKKREDVMAEWRPEAIERSKQQLVLIEIARKETISEDAKELQAIVEDVTKKDPKADEASVRSHYQVLLRNDKVLQFLENQK